MAIDRRFVNKATSSIWKAGDKFDEEGAFESVRYQNEDNGFVIGTFKPKDKKETIVCKGTIPAFVLGAPYHLTGKVVDDKTWGIQVDVARAATVKPSGTDELIAFLGSGSIPGIGPVTARRIVKMFGEDTLEVLEESPERLIEVPGIGHKNIERMKKTLPDMLKYREVIGFFAEIGVSLTTTNRLIKEYGSRARQVVEGNPYVLCKVRGFAFTRADSIAMKMGIDKYDENRLEAGVLATLRWMSDAYGHTVVPRDQLLAEALEKLKVKNGSKVELALDRLVRDKRVIVDDIGVHIKALYYDEKSIKKALRDASKEDPILTREQVDELMGKCSADNGLTLSDEQADAVRNVFKRSISIMSGGAGCGKTATCKMVVDVAKSAGMEVCLMSPTGRAAKHLSDVCGAPGYTMHRALAIMVRHANDEDFFSDDETDSIRNRTISDAVSDFNKADIIIADETSMMDTSMAAILFKACKNKHLMLVGDPNQLPSVGPGQVLRDLMESSYSRTGMLTMLTKIFRQAEGSPVIAAANAIQAGKSPCYVKGVTFLDCKSNEEVLERFEKDVIPRLRREKLGYADYMIMSPIKKTPYSGVNALNELLRPKLNPHYRKPKNEKLDFLLQQGDIVMQTKNNYDVDIYNGDIGIVTEVDEDGNVSVLYSGEDEEVEYEKDEVLDNVILAYCCTVHKKQGDQSKLTIVVMTSSHFAMLNRNLLYTAVTRAEKDLILIGDAKAFAMAARNEKENNRMTGLKGI